jgi:peptide deformylase
MAVLTIRTVPDPILKRKAKRISTIDRSIKKLVKDMCETLHAEEGRAGLAAPQIGVSLRVTVISMPDVEGDIVLINPEIVKRKGQRLVNEGCLSIPGYMGQLYRAEAVTVKGLDATGKEVRIKGDGLLGQALEHEIDHLNGILYVDRMEDMSLLKKVEPEQEQDGI